MTVPKVIVVVEGGVIERVVSDAPVRVVIYDSENVREIAEAGIYFPVEVKKSLVNEYIQEVKEILTETNDEDESFAGD